MAQASHSADRSPVLSSSCLVSSHLISLPLLSFLLLSSLLSSVHRCLCSAQQFGTFRVTVSRLFYHLRAIIYHLRVAHNVHSRTHHHRDSLLLSTCDVDFPAEESWTMWSHPALMMKLERMSHTAESFLLSSFWDRGFYILMADLKSANEYIYICTRKLNIEKHIFVLSTLSTD